MTGRRLGLSAAVMTTGALGYWLRFHAPIPDWLRDMSGGAAYVVFWIFVAALVKPTLPVFRLSVAILTITFSIEFLQSWHPAWLEQIRRTLPGRLILGTTFDWLDFPPYVVGAVIGWAALLAIRAVSKSSASKFARR